MPAVCFYFQVHQPFRLRPFSYFDIGHGTGDYFDDRINSEIVKKVARKCYLPTNAKLLELIERHEGAFKVAFAITGVAIEQFVRWQPKVLESFQRLVETGCVELLCETTHHSLAAIHDAEEFAAQVDGHRARMSELFGQTPRVFRNTELIYDDRIGALVEGLGFDGMIAEGADDILDWRSPGFVYRRPGGALKLLLKNYKLSDDIAFRFSDPNWSERPLTPAKYASWLHHLTLDPDKPAPDTVNLFMDYETFGEHQWAESGIFEFLDGMPAAVLQADSADAAGEWRFATPSELLDECEVVADLSYPRTTSWADQERDLTAWSGNPMQTQALAEVYSLAGQVRARNNPAATELWRKLLTSDHFYYMCTKFFADGDVHMYFNHYESPYDAFINFMNVLTDFREHVLGAPRAEPPRAEPAAG